MQTRALSDRQRWWWAIGLSLVPPLLSAGFFTSADLIDGGASEPSIGFGIAWYAWVGGSAAAAIAAGVVGGFARGAITVVALWVLVIGGTLVAFGQGCPLNMSRAPSGSAALLYLGPTEQCPDGTSASAWALGFLAPLIGIPCTLLTLGGGIVGEGIRWALRRWPAAAG